MASARLPDASGDVRSTGPDVAVAGTVGRVAYADAYRPLDAGSLLAPPPTDHAAADRWAASGAMALTGRRDGPPLVAPGLLMDRLDSLAARLALLTRALGRAVIVDGPALLGERAAIASLARRGSESVGGGTRLLEAVDGWVAVSVVRPDDADLLPAFVGIALADDGQVPWRALEAAVRCRPATALVERATLLGLAVTALGETMPGAPLLAHERGDADAVAELDGLLVVDLSALWAGPLCTSLLAAAGARVLKVESSRRPDGARLGASAFFDLLNAGKESVALDFGSPEGRGVLRRLVERADVVVEASRRRALDQLGCAVDALPSGTGPRVWISITAHGRHASAADRVGFGDDAAVAAGLVAHDTDGPCFVADAVADPVTGLLAAVAALDRLAAGGRWHLDIALARAARWARGPDEGTEGTARRPAASASPVQPPRSRPVPDVARPFGADTARVLSELGVA